MVRVTRLMDEIFDQCRDREAAPQDPRTATKPVARTQETHHPAVLT